MSNDPTPTPPPRPVYDAYAYPTDPYGGGYGGGDSAAFQRTVRQVLAVLRERLWYIVAVFMIVSGAGAVYTLTRTKLYTAAAVLEILPREAVVMKVEEVRAQDLRGPEDLNTQVKILESGAIIQQVVERLTPAERETLLGTAVKEDPTVTPVEIIARGRRVAPVRLTRVLQVSFTHPSPELAARVANLLVDEFISYNSRWRVDESLRAAEELKVRAEQQGRKVNELAGAIQQYKERENLVSLDKRKDIVTDRLMSLSALLTQSRARFADIERRWVQVQEVEKAGGSLTDLDFVSGSPLVQTLVQRAAAVRIEVAELERRYRAKHPRMIQAAETLARTEAELKGAVAAVAASVKNERDAAERALEAARADLAAQEAESLRLDRIAVEYKAMENELAVNENLLMAIQSRMRETSMSASIDARNSRVVDRAAPPQLPSSPNTVMFLALSGFAGLGLGLGLAVALAFLDDRVKSADQVEREIGLPLLAVVPRLAGSTPGERARCVVDEGEPLAAEAFRSAYSSLRLLGKEQPSKVLVITSTTPGEGKSFVATNLALTCAAHGERTLLIDGDLRKPNIRRSFDLQTRAGLIEALAGSGDVEALIVREFVPSLDVLPAGEQRIVPTRAFGDARFAAWVRDWRERYDRIVIDTPPLGPVSDALSILPHADGSLLVLRYNRVKRMAAALSARRLRESKTACLGVVLNGLNLSMSDYYYAGHYGRASHDYLMSGERKG